MTDRSPSGTNILIFSFYKGERGLKFFQGKSIGPINKSFIYNSDDQAVALKVKTLMDKEEETYAYLNGGCYFLPYDQNKLDNGTRVLATYATNDKGLNAALMEDYENRIAIVECAIGMGKCLLSGVHFEINASSLDLSNENIRLNVYNKLSEAHAGNTCEEHSNHRLIRYLFAKVFNLC
jgi:glutamine amidotransferase-like uncharacterized protein